MTASNPAVGRHRARTASAAAEAEASAGRATKRAQAAKAAAATRRRRPIAVVYDIDGPRVRLGIAWFLLVVVGLWVGTIGVAVVYGLAAALAATQVARSWRRAKGRPDRPNDAVAAACAAALPAAAAIDTAVLGGAILAVVAACLLTSRPANGIRTLQCAIWPGAAAAAVVVTHRFEPWAAVALVLVVSSYEIGDFLVGSGARNALEGPIAGAAAVVVVGAAAGLIAFGVPDNVYLAALGAVLCPIGQLVGSLVLPSHVAKAPALRRLDSLLVLGPMWAWLAGQAAQVST